MAEVQYNVLLTNGAHANIVGSAQVVEQMYPGWEDNSEAVYRTVAPSNVHLFNSALNFQRVESDTLAILGNTKTSTCAVAADCGSCALAGKGLSIEMMSDQNCARANTARVFESIRQEPEGRFMLLPLSNNVLVITDETPMEAEYNGNELMQNRLPDAAAVVFTDLWLYDRGLNEASFAMNGADGSFGLAKTTIQGEKVYIPFCSLRTNMGDRGEDAQIIRKAINAYLDSKEIKGEERREVIEGMQIDITLSASAELKNFAHKIQIPEKGTKYDIQLREKYPELIGRANGKVTSAIVLNDQYPGAFNRRTIYPQLEAEMGIHESPITPDNCPGDGQTCHVDYRTETEYAIRSQLKQMGIAPDNIVYDDSQALDPASPTNNMASNRREQNNGVATPKTLRTLNGVQLRVKGPENAKLFERAAGMEAVGMLLNMPLEYPQPDMTDPMVALYVMRMGHAAPPRELWDKVSVRKEAREMGFHPMVYWLTLSTSVEDHENETYQRWIDGTVQP